MSKLLFIATFLISFHLIQSEPLSCLNQCSTMKFFGCQICYKICEIPSDPITPNVTLKFSLHYQTCRQSYCVREQEYTYTVGNETYTSWNCVEYDWYVYDEAECTQKCCNNPYYNQFTNQTFTQCVAINEQLHQERNKDSVLAGIIVGGVFGSIILIFLLYCCICKICECLPDCLRSHRSSQGPQNLNLPYLNNPAVNISCDSLKQKMKNLQNLHHSALSWVQTESNLKQSGSQYCSICLDGNMNCQTSCGHKFHLLCFQDWIRKNPDCPLCKNKNFNDIQIYCQKCKYRQSTIKITPSIILDGINGNMITCDECANAPNGEQSEHKIKTEKP